MFSLPVSVLLALAALATAAPSNRKRDILGTKQELLGTNFGVPVINQTFDYVIAGGGTAGLTLAYRLSCNPNVSVAVVEAGSFYEFTNGNYSQLPGTDVAWTGKSPKDVNPLVDWGFVTTPQVNANNVTAHYARGKTLGGSSARNYMAYLRGTKQSYQLWADQVGDQSYTFDNLLPYFERPLNFTPPNNQLRGANATPSYDPSTLGNGAGPLALSFSNYAQAFSTWAQKGLAEIGVLPTNGFTSGSLNGSAFSVTTIDHTTGQRESSETAFLRAALGRTNLVVYTQTMVKQILFNGTTATGLLVQSGNVQYMLSARKEVISCAGAFQSPQLLMVSGVGPAATLKKFNIPVVADRPGVGQNLRDHIIFGPSYRVNVVTDSLLYLPQYAGPAAEEFNSYQGGLLSNNGGDMLAWEKLPKSITANFTPQAQADLAKFPADWPNVEYLPVSGFFGYQYSYTTQGPFDGNSYGTLAAALASPLSIGNVTISSADTYDQPVINPNWLDSPTDQAVAVAAYKRARAVFTSPSMHNITIGPEYFPGAQVQTDAQILELIRESLLCLYHASCTCAMGKSNDNNAVVDTQGRVYGTKNLRVVDISIFPFLPPGHPQATVYALAEKIADCILGTKQC